MMNMFSGGALERLSIFTLENSLTKGRKVGFTFIGMHAI